MNNDSIDKMAEVYTGDEDDAKAYQRAQQAVVITQTRTINQLKSELEKLSKQLEQLTIENTRLKALGDSPAGNVDVSDAEQICLVQLALLNNYSMQRELTLEECKKSEIYVKTLTTLRGKQEKKEENTIGALSNEELMEAMKNLG